MRLFIAVPLADKTKDELVKWQQKLKDELPDKIKWVKPENYHITLKFLGETDLSTSEKLISALEDLSCNKAFFADIQTLSAFPSIKKPRVLITKVVNNKQKISKIYNLVEKIAVNNGFKSDKREFEPHITLARIKDKETQNITAKWFLNSSRINLDKIEFEVDRICLIKSKLTNQGPIYEEIFCKNYK